MPSISRGLCAHAFSLTSRPVPNSLPKQLPARIICLGHAPVPRRLFGTITQLRAQAGAAAITKTSKATTAAPAPRRQPAKPPTPSRSSISPTTPYIPPPSPAYAATLASKPTPTLLYEAPSHFWFTFSAFNAGAFCIAYTAVQYYSVYLHPPPDLAWWVPHAYGLICVTMGAVGTYWLRWPSRIIRSISALPASDFRGLKLEVKTRKVIPFLPWKKTVVMPHEVTIPDRVQRLIGAATRRPGTEKLSAKEQLMLKAYEEEKKKAARQYELDHIMTAPFRHAGRAIGTATRGMVRALTRDGFANVSVKGAKYKMDVKSGWFLEEGKALDRLVHVKAEEATGLEKMIKG
ncbi:hypothetical protein DL546_001105 [Coniochaeta pulveracea]|uniref:Uncharacterized protein n=1 Tax=Coniochaeta pulveracea TaxID=177199 RepID=A0A420XWN4_9PEZI|nr:hypothetical protein DL546_001105 [Coniochaeta pulveracea]